MIIERRVFLLGSMIGVAGLAMPSVSLAQTFNQSAKAIEDDVTAQMVAKGFTDFIMVNKREANLLAVLNGEAYLRAPVIIGRTEKGKSLTPSGIFSLVDVYNDRSVILFHHDDMGAYLLHDVIKGREFALSADNRKLSRMSAGCINAPKAGLDFILNFARWTALQRDDSQATQLVITPERYSPAWMEQQLKIVKPEKYIPR